MHGLRRLSANAILLKDLLLIGAMCCAYSLAATAPLGKITLTQALSKALQTNPDLLVTRANLTQAKASTSEVKKSYLPHLSAEGQYSTSDDVATQLPDANHAVVQVSEDLFQGGRVFSDIDRLKHLENSALSLTEQKKQEVVFNVKRNYYLGLSALEQLDEWKAATDEYNHLLKLIEPKFTVGSVPEYDYAKVRLSLSSYEQETLKSQALLGHELQTLGALMGSDPPEGLTQVEEPTSPPSLNPDEILTKALSQRPDLKASESQVLAERSAVTQAKLERLPDIKVGADYGYGGLTFGNQSLGWGVTATLGIPIFDFGAISSRIDQASAQLLADESRLESLRLQIRTDIFDTVQGVNIAWAALKAAENNWPAAKRAYQSSLRRYRTGLAPMTELSDAHSLLIQSQIGLSQARAEYRIALARLDLMQGLMDNPAESHP